MRESPWPQFEIGNTVKTDKELIIGLKGQPKDFYLMMDVAWSERTEIWVKVERETRQKIDFVIQKMFQQGGKTMCLVKFTVTGIPYSYP